MRGPLVVSVMVGGGAGSLYTRRIGVITPSALQPATSSAIIVWVAVGGRGTLVGAVLGAILVNAGKTYFTGAIPEFWLFALGGLFVFVTLFLPRGILGLISSWKKTPSGSDLSSPSGGTPKPTGQEGD